MNKSVLSPADYKIGWICGRVDGVIAAKALLDEFHEQQSDIFLTDDNSYTFGKIGGHNVVIAIQPWHNETAASTSNAAMNMIRSFSNIRLCFMVGIGGGIPSAAHDIRLGDVVVGSSNGAVGALLHYDISYLRIGIRDSQ